TIVVVAAVVFLRFTPMGRQIYAMGNDLEAAALAVAPALGAWRDRLGDATGARPRLAGSGSTWFVEGAFPGEDRVVVRAATVDGTALAGRTEA
ncbi:MAG: hypothetical protein AAGK32_13240, partial [Actinomycetota bacterium]